ncbi:MAG: class II aldolase/adducin family protein [Bacillota bacterium]|nr:class II aldolase/adducin family protein [Bacillota bacterium]
MKYIEERNQLIEYGRKMSQDSLSPGTSGNLSIFLREEKLLLISPSGMDYFNIEPEDLVLMDLDGKIIEGKRKPSCEWQLHTNFYKAKADIGALVHTHSLNCACLAAMRMPIEAVHYVIGDANTNKVMCSPYYRFGTEKLARAAVETCGRAKAVLLANHGLVTCGKDLEAAYSLAKNLEYVAEIQVKTMSMGRPYILNKKEMDQVIQGFKGYGQGTEE